MLAVLIAVLCSLIAGASTLIVSLLWNKASLEELLEALAREGLVEQSAFCVWDFHSTSGQPQKRQVAHCPSSMTRKNSQYFLIYIDKKFDRQNCIILELPYASAIAYTTVIQGGKVTLPRSKFECSNVVDLVLRNMTAGKRS